MNKNISNLAKFQLSEHIRTQYPAFIEFIELYYKYIEQRTHAAGVVLNATLDADIDTTLDAYVDDFYNTYGKLIPKKTKLNRRTIIKLLNSLYKIKGTDESYKLLFRVLYDEELEITRPAEQILKASDGVWTNESFITVKTVFGEFPAYDGSIPFEISNENGSFFIFPIKHEIVDGDIVRIFYVSTSKLLISVNNTVKYTPVSIPTYKGTIIDSPIGMEVLSVGKKFQVGQIFRIAGTHRDSYLKVIAVDSIGGITNVEIFSYGFNHPIGQLLFITPYKAVPPVVNQSYYQIETAPGVYERHISISESVYGLKDDISGYTHLNSTYFLENYVDDAYAAEYVIDNHDNQLLIPPSVSTQDPELSVSEYYESQAILKIIGGPVVKIQGKFQTDSGKLSNQSIRLQDSYYQLFSYVINSNVDRSVYYSAVRDILHPAGLKMFSARNFTNYVDSSPNGIGVDRKNTFRLECSDNIVSIDEIANAVHTERTDYTSINEAFAKQILIPTDETASMVDTATNRYLLNPSDAVAAPSDDKYFIQAKNINDVLSSDVYSYNNEYFNESYSVMDGVSDLTSTSKY
jgi:hypothetical protein